MSETTHRPAFMDADTSRPTDDRPDPETLTREQLITELRGARRAGITLGMIIQQQGRAALEASGRYDVIQDDGDGDWALVWETLAALRPERDAALGKLADVRKCIDDASKTAWRMSTLSRRLDAILDRADGAR